MNKKTTLKKFSIQTADLHLLFSRSEIPGDRQLGKVLYLDVMPVHEVVQDLDGEMERGAGQLQLLRNNARPVH
jgi:hypothetical protein